MTIPSYLVGDRNVLEAVARQHWQAVYMGDKTVLCRILGKYIIYADVEDIGITPHLCLNGYWEPWITVAIARILKPGWYCVDVGANHGYYTAIMADAVGPAGRVLAIEPNPRLMELLQFTLEVNGFLGYTATLQKALTHSESQRVNLVIPRNRGGNSTLFREALASDGTVEVETDTLDNVTKEWGHVDLVKIDAEGAEVMIWQGMRQTLERNPNIHIIMEINCARYTDPQSFVRDIQEAGFELRYIDYDCAIKNITQRQILTDRFGEDWMLYLNRA